MTSSRRVEVLTGVQGPTLRTVLGRVNPTTQGNTSRRLGKDLESHLPRGKRGSTDPRTLAPPKVWPRLLSSTMCTPTDPKTGGRPDEGLVDRTPSCPQNLFMGSQRPLSTPEHLLSKPELNRTRFLFRNDIPLGLSSALGVRLSPEVLHSVRARQTDRQTVGDELVSGDTGHKNPHIEDGERVRSGRKTPALMCITLYLRRTGGLLHGGKSSGGLSSQRLRV